MLEEEATKAAELLKDCVSSLEELNTLKESTERELIGIESRHEMVAGYTGLNKEKYEAAKVELANIQKLEKAWARKQQLIEEATAIQAKLDELVDPGEYTGPNAEEAQKLWVQAEAEYDNVNDALDTLVGSGGDRCPTCDKTLTEAERNQLAKAKKAQLEELSVLIDEAKKLSCAADQEKIAWSNKAGEFKSKSLKYTTQLEGYMDQLDAMTDVTEPHTADDAQKVVDDYESNEESANKLAAKLNEYKSLVREINTKLSAAYERRDELKEKAESADPVELSKAKAAVEIEETKISKVSELDGVLSEIEQQLSDNKESLKQLREDEVKAKKLNEYLSYLEFARQILHRDNFPAGKVKAFVDAMLVQTNDYLEEMQSGFSVSYDNDEGFTAHFPAGAKLPDRQVDIRADRLSGGEKCIFALAFRFSVNDLKSDTGFIILDEPTAPLDDDHVDHVVEALARVKSKLVPRVQVIVVTHDERLMTVADKVVQMK